MVEEPIGLTLTREELEETLGVFFLGYVLSSVIYGFNFFQTWRYSSRFSSDPLLLRTFVATVCALDLATVALTSHALYIYLIELFPKTIGLVNIIVTLSTEILLAVVSTFLVQSYYAHRLWFAHKKNSVAMVLEILSLGALALGIADVSRDRTFDVLGLLHVRLQITFRHILVLLAGLILAIMQWRLPVQCFSSRADGEKQDWFDKLVLCVITRFGMANVAQLGYLITFVTVPRTAFWLPFHLCAQKLYVNSFLNELNSRPVQGHNNPINPRQSFVNPAHRSITNDAEIFEDNKSAAKIPKKSRESNPQLTSEDNGNQLGIPTLSAEDDTSSYSWGVPEVVQEDRCKV